MKFSFFTGNRHNDLPWNIRRLIQNDMGKLNFSGDLRNVEPWASHNESHTDIPRLRQGHVGVQFWVAYTDCESQQIDSVEQTLEQIDVIRSLTEQYEDLQFCSSVDEILSAVRNGKIASLIGIEGGHSIQSSPGILRQMYNLGVRYLTLTHNCNTPWADASPMDSPQMKNVFVNFGLSQFGLELLDEMNRLGMMIDLSHVSEATMKLTLARSRAPVIFSHSGAKAICDHHRNVADSVLEKLVSILVHVAYLFFAYFYQLFSVLVFTFAER